MPLWQGIKIRSQADGTCRFARPFNPELDALYITPKMWEEFCTEPFDRLSEPDLRNRSVDLHSDLTKIAVSDTFFLKNADVGGLPEMEMWFECLRVLFIVVGTQPNDLLGPWRWEMEGTEGAAFFWNKDSETFDLQEGSENIGVESLYERIREAAHKELREELIKQGLNTLEIRPVFTLRR
jgi:hypothetical protein